MIHLTVATAGLFAQVLPVLALALLLEVKISLRHFANDTKAAIVFEILRLYAVMGGMLMTIDCLHIVGTNREGIWLEDLLLNAYFWVIAIVVLWVPVQMTVPSIFLLVDKVSGVKDNRSEPPAS